LIGENAALMKREFFNARGKNTVSAIAYYIYGESLLTDASGEFAFCGSCGINHTNGFYGKEKK